MFLSVTSSVPGEDLLSEVKEEDREGDPQDNQPGGANGHPSNPPAAEQSASQASTSGYQESPTSRKRRVLQDLAQSRQKKRRL